MIKEYFDKLCEDLYYAHFAESRDLVMEVADEIKANGESFTSVQRFILMAAVNGALDSLN